MNQTEVSNEDVAKSLNLFQYVIFSQIKNERQRELEEHLLSNNKIISIYGNVVAEICNIEFFDDPEGDIEVEPGVIQSARRCKWGHRFRYLSEDKILDEPLVCSIAYDGLKNGFPLGFITNNEERKEQLENLGTVIKGDFSNNIQVEGIEINVYNSLKEMPIYAPGMYQQRN